MRRIQAFEAGLIAFGAALNVSAGYLTNVLKLPLYLDSIGTVLISALCGWKYGVIVGLTALVVMTGTASPTALAYSGTAIMIAVCSFVLAEFGFLKSKKGTLIGGLILGCVSSLMSFPITAFLFGGVSLAGSDVLTAAFRTAGMPVWKSVFLGGLITDPVDKLFTSFICLSLMKSMPASMLERMPRRGTVS